jgi:peptidoglycan/xylan/chitin deacetylase (PgdA/CDA1 family)
MAIQKLASELEVSQQKRGNSQKLIWQEIEEMSKENITFGAHTVTHPILTSLPLSEAMDEITASKKVIEEKLKHPVRLFAYPNGSRDDFSEPIKQLLKEAGFMGAVTTLWGANGVHIDPFELRRMGIWDLDPQVSAFKLAWYYFNS